MDERRSHRRYPLDLAIRCKVLKNGLLVSGRVHDISSRSVCFVSAETFPVGTVEGQVQLFMDWPFCLADETARVLTAWGSAVRTGSQGIVVSFRRYEFHR